MSYYDDLSVGGSTHGDCYDLSGPEHSDVDDDDDDEEHDGCDDEEWLTGKKTRTQTNSKLPQNQPSPSPFSSSSTKFATLATGLWDRCILHLDVDCFYCQCEEIDRNLRDNNAKTNHSRPEKDRPRPLAIGQKHIIVTCNYEARKYGVQKLQSRENAYRMCPDLWIVEGSDLLHYRRHSRAIYEAFRGAIQEISKDVFGDNNDNHNIDYYHNHNHNQDHDLETQKMVPAKKGCMDEMTSDLTRAVETIWKQRQHSQEHGIPPSKHSTTTVERNDADQARFVFGDDASSSVAVLVEDQTDEKSIVAFQPSSTIPGGRRQREDATLTEARRNIHDVCGATVIDRRHCQDRLGIAADLTARVCEYIRQTTGFHTTGGVSVSPLLAKLASGLHKPKSVNLLYPWRSSQLLYSMPLRKMDRIGHGTMKALERTMAATAHGNLLQQTGSPAGFNGSGAKKKMRTVRDLLELPRDTIRVALQGMSAFQADTSSEDQCDLLLQQCRGLDTSEVLDDEGTPSKTVSVENSFRRGTIRTTEAVHKALEDLYRRLPLLIQDRTSWAVDPSKAYPSTIRLTIRMVDSQLSLTKKRRPYVTKSKQGSIDGKRHLIQEPELQIQSNTIRLHVAPLLRQLLPVDVDITRMNIAVTNFQDAIVAQVVDRGSGQATLAESLERKRMSTGPSQTFQMRQNNVSSQYANKRSKHNSQDCDSVGSQESQKVSPNDKRLSIPSKTGLNQSRTTQWNNSNGRMKSTRIDHFFFKK